jgi:RNA polymerase sigma-70 factor (ECF subfamily)
MERYPFDAAGTALDQSVTQEMAVLLPRLRRFAYGLTGSIDAGDDLVQSACERALSRLHQWQAGTRLDSWMYRIMQNLWFDELRAERRREVVTEELDAMTGGDAETEMAMRLDLAVVRRRIADLSPDQRAVLLLVSVDGLSYKEAAAILGVPIGTVMSRLARARLALARALEPAVITGGIA